MTIRPKGVLIDCGGTLLEETFFDPRPGDEWLLDRTSCNPSQVTIDQISERRRIIDDQVIARRDECRVETPWPMLMRLIYDFFGIQFDSKWADLELDFWKACMDTKPMPGAIEALNELHRNDIPTAVVSNSIYGSTVLHYELARKGLAEHLRFIMTSSEYSVRKPSPLLFDIAAARLGIRPADIWFVGDRLDIDVNGAISAGMTPVWFQPPEGSSPSCLSVANWSDFLDHLKMAV